MIVIVDYDMGNLGSIANMLKKVGAKATISSDPAVVGEAEKLILPGVGAFDNGMKNLNEMGLLSVLNQKVLREKTPVLGVCLGMQLLTRRSEEGKLPGLGWIEADTIKFNFNGQAASLKVPHMGWNYIDVCQTNSLFQEMPDHSRFYFVHSYYVNCDDNRTILATARYGLEFAAAVASENVLGVQFHPEKSHKFGMRLYKNFVERF